MKLKNVFKYKSMFITKNKINVKDILNFARLISFFTVLKFLVFVSPLILNEIIPLNLFGEFEYTFNLGQTIVGMFSMGLVSSYAYFILTKDQKQKAPIIHMHFLVISLAVLLIALTNLTLLSNNLFGSILIAISIANQQIVSGYLKIKDHNFYAIAIDTGIYIILFTIVVLSYFKIVDFSLRIWFTLLLIYITLYAVLFHLKRIIGIKLNERKDFYEVYKFGVFVFLSGPLLLLINAGSRIYIEHFFDLETVGVYSYYFRISSVVLIFSRVIHILLFKKVFQFAHEELDKTFSQLITIIFLVNLICFLLVYFLSDKLSFLLLDDKYLLLICFFQINFWISNSFLEPVIQRKNIVLYFIVVMLILITIMFCSFVLLESYNMLSLKKLIWINTLVIYLLFLGQQYILGKTGQLYTKSLSVHIIQGLIFIPTIFYLD
jgi:O-antigen/teichoic acid export membrane protein